ncbi:unnamed protein product [Rotaria magnacalcarata]|uniref:IQ calmodulin-binding motif-containing protein 1 n=5 Tax=Rotaria magnacalcarata TaxID=392030 RepID=A0A816ZMD2_9BILA|nr:unnamed protein product [Rotaria magnacalcarata]CAF1974350.1 unnamed protein product [Rotaria magnacalcarata]CAF2124538.1 unnamed protein product [Rotaria magnacalcarata]CAF2214925.1 unnamed protein product [Rotaria magnacalcarata]
MSSNLVGFAKELSRTKPGDLPEKFLQLDNILQRSKSITSVKHEIISLDILPILLLTLRQDFTAVPNGWRLASISLSKLACSCMCVELDRNNAKTKTWSTKFYDQYLPQGIDSFILLTRHMQDRYTHEKKSHIGQDYLSYMNTVISNLLELLAFHANEYSLIKQILVSPKFMELFLTDDVYLCSLMISMFEDVIRKSGRLTGASVFYELSNKLKQDYVNELAYKLTVFDNNDVGRAAVRALIAVCETDPNIVFLLADKFKGLPTILQRWHGRGFGMDLQDLLAILNRGVKGGHYSREYQRENYAASKIQALWRGYTSRKRLEKANQAMKQFHNSFRKRKRRETEIKEEQRQRAEVQYLATRDHYRRLRQFKLQQIQAIQLLPASEIEKYLEIQRLRSATKIQAVFRGYLLRRTLADGDRDRLIMNRAARRIQRSFHRYRQRKQAELDRRQKRLEYIKPTILTEAKREELIEQIDKWRSERAPRAMSDEEFLALHGRAQEHLNRYVTTNRAWRRIEQRQRLLLHMLNNDSEFLLSNYPKLKFVMEPNNQTILTTNHLDQAATYLNHPSSAIRYRAREAHNEALKYARAPWYKGLQIANTQDDDDDDDEDEYFNRGGLDDFSRNDILSNPVRFEYEKRKFHQFTPNTTTSSIEHHQ